MLCSFLHKFVCEHMHIYCVCVCTCASGCVLFLYASQPHMVPAFPDLSEAFRRSQTQDLTAGIVPSQGLFFEKIIFLPKILKSGKIASCYQKQSMKLNAQHALLIAMCKATYTFLLLNQRINVGLAHNESRRFINNCLRDKSQKILHLCLCQCFWSAIILGKT